MGGYICRSSAEAMQLILPTSTLFDVYAAWNDRSRYHDRYIVSFAHPSRYLVLTGNPEEIDNANDMDQIRNYPNNQMDALLQRIRTAG